MSPQEKYLASKDSAKDKVSSQTLRMDELISTLGNPGRYQIIILVLLCLNYCPLVFNHVIMAFFGARSGHECHAFGGQDYFTENGMNVTIADRVNGKCSSNLTLGFGETKIVTCKSGDWKYSTDDHETNIVTEWDLVCDDSYLRPLATTIYFCGVMVGGLLFGHLSDKFGRRPIMLITLFAPVVIGIGIYFVPSYPWFVVLRFIDGIFLQGLQISSYVLLAEMFLPKYRPMAGALIECFWGASVMMLAGIVYFIRDWRYVQLAICLPSLLALFYFCVIPESLRWMIMYGKIDGAKKYIERVVKFNKLEFPHDSWLAVKAMAEGRREAFDRQYSFLSLLRTPRLRKRSFILFYLWLAVSVGYYGLTFKITSLAGNKYLNFFIGACVEMCAYLLDIVILIFVRRRPSVIAYAMLAAVMCIVAGAIPPVVTDSGLNLVTVSTGFAIVGRFAVAGLFGLLFLYTSELYPTVIRNIGMGTCAFWTRLGGVLAPQINSLGHYTSEQVPVIVFGVMMLVSALLAVLLPETHRKNLADTIDDIEGGKLMSEMVQVAVPEKDRMNKADLSDKGDVFTRL